MQADTPHRSPEAPDRPPRRFLLIGDVGGAATFHLGDEAMLQANLERLREMCPGAELTVASRDPAWTSSQYGVRSVPRPSLPGLSGSREPTDAELERLVSESLQPPAEGTEGPEPAVPRDTVRALAEADGLLVSGGGNLNGSWPEQLYERVILLEMADRLGVPAVVTGQTLGPHLGPRQREVLRRVLSRLPFVGVREAYSLGIGNLLGVAPEHLGVHVDDAFFGPRPSPSSRRNRLEGERAPWIAVTMTRLPGPVEPLAEQLGRVARATSCRLLFVPHAKEPDGDVEVARALVELLDREVEAEVVPVPSAEEGRRLTEGAALVLSMRYHPLVFGVAGLVPALGLYVDEYTRVKLRGALGHGGLEDWVLPLEMALAGGLAEASLDLWRQDEAIRRHLATQEARWGAMERSYRSRLARALGLEGMSEGEAPRGGEAAPAPGSAPSGAPQPSSAWGEVARRTEGRADLWFTERLQLLEQVDSAVEYALSLERTLVERDREIDGLKRLLDLHKPVETGDGVGAEAPK